MSAENQKDLQASPSRSTHELRDLRLAIIIAVVFASISIAVTLLSNDVVHTDDDGQQDDSGNTPLSSTRLAARPVFQIKTTASPLNYLMTVIASRDLLSSDTSLLRQSLKQTIHPE